MKNFIKISAIVAIIALTLVMPKVADAQYDNAGWDSYDVGYYDNGGWDSYDADYYAYDDCSYYDCGYGYDNYGYDNYGYDNCGYDCYDSGYGYGYDNYGYGYNDCYYDCYNTTPPFVFTYNPPSNNNGSVVVNNNNSNVNNNTNNNNVVVNVPGGNNNDNNHDLEVDCEGSPSNPDEDETVTWTADVSGGSGSYHYDWSGTNGLSGSSRTVHKRYSSEGTKSATVHVTSGGQSASASCDVDVNNNINHNNDDLDVYCVGSPSNPDADEQVRWEAHVSGGDSPYDYRWSGDVSGDNRTEYETYNRSGIQTARIRVEDDNGDTATDECSVYVQDHYTPINYTNTPSSGIYLSQIPATGINPTTKLALFILGLSLWSAFGAYLILQRRKMAALATVGIEGVDLDAASDESENEVSKEASEDDQAESFEDNISFRAREKNVLISRDGIEAIVARASGKQSEAENILDQVISKVNRNEGDYATLNSEKINQLLN